MTLLDRALFKFLKIERSFSQSGEDKILSLLFKKFGKVLPSYLDVGSNHPIMSNNTYLFYLRGATGLCVEPNPEFVELYKKSRPRDKCLNVGIGFRDGRESGEFYVMSSHTLSTFSKKDAHELDAQGTHRIERVLNVPLVNINSVIQENFDNAPDLVSIDVEGWNEEIALSLDLTRYRPFCFCVETVKYFEDNSEKKLDSIVKFFTENNYAVYADTHINTIFVDRDVLSKK